MRTVIPMEVPEGFMKAKFWFAAAIALLAGEVALAQDLHTVVLELDPRDQNPSSSLTLSLNGAKSPPAHFVLKARVGDQIRWKAITSSEDEGDVRITRIQYLSGPRIFSKDLITGNSALQATVIRGGNAPYVYKIHFALDDQSKEEVITSRIQILQ
ncbi:hypothetical protein SAMN06265375_103342 [Muriicola jejuensis]|uniref:Uncharacterized protein n=1 Tax=Muriicola jejuensis TaxID=504488 RepID=A0A6P0UJQ9_9FLAO|nr:hypothetical protein [Muriicola jejuensis]NER11303.1 hypothetical protein [Muriicola jejuensis]SMP21620.1 hypothetical protein SAMN06265375_103342 [Muriicola jejuensis]